MGYAREWITAWGPLFGLPPLALFSILGAAIAGVVDYRQLLRAWQWGILGSFILGAMVTPPDTTSQIIASLPLCVAYFVSIGLAFLIGKRPRRFLRIGPRL